MIARTATHIDVDGHFWLVDEDQYFLSLNGNWLKKNKKFFEACLPVAIQQNKAPQPFYSNDYSH